MDLDLQKRVEEAMQHLNGISIDGVDYGQMDPIAKMMLVALLHEEERIRDYIGSTPKRIEDRFCSHFIPNKEVSAVPAIALLAPTFRKDKVADCVSVSSSALFTYKVEGQKMPVNYIPIFDTLLIPHAGLVQLIPQRLTTIDGSWEVASGKPNSVWIGIQTNLEMECLRGLSLLVRGSHGILPERVSVGLDNRVLDIATMHEMENIDMLEPFDAQQASGQFFSFVKTWKECLLNMDDAALMYITDTTTDRDLFKPRPYPKVFQQWLEDEMLDRFTPNTLWLQLEFASGYVVPDTCQVSINILPVTNVDVCSLTLTQSEPIKKLQKQEGSFFLQILETSNAAQKQGFGKNDEDIIVRDFDASCYNDGDLYRDVRTLYNHFIDDYYAFIEYNGIKDGEVLRQLRETINRLGKSVGQSNDTFKFDSGTYVMKNMSNQDSMASNVKVSFITTMGRAGNDMRATDKDENAAIKKKCMAENKKLPALNKEVAVAVSAMGGADKASADVRYEMLRYYALTNDRLYTRMDIDAFLRKEIMAEFGKKEFGEKDARRIFIRINIEGAAGDRALRRGLYIDLEFKDRKNYDHAVRIGFDTLMRQRIENHSCIAMPIIVTLKNLEG